MKLTDHQRLKGKQNRRAAAKARREMVNVKTVATGRRRSGDVRPIRVSVASFCSECSTGYGLDCGGFQTKKQAIEACTSRKCHLWPWRGGRDHPEEIKKEREDLDAG